VDSTGFQAGSEPARCLRHRQNLDFHRLGPEPLPVRGKLCCKREVKPASLESLPLQARYGTCGDTFERPLVCDCRSSSRSHDCQSPGMQFDVLLPVPWYCSNCTRLINLKPCLVGTKIPRSLQAQNPKTVSLISRNSNSPKPQRLEKIDLRACIQSYKP
jgi:hypothetical protein